MKKTLKYFFFALVALFALIGATFTAVFIAMQFGLLNVRGSILERNSFFNAPSTDSVCIVSGQTHCAWNETPQWKVVAGGLEKDATVINKVAAQTGVPARLIAAVVVPEQIRFFTSEREVFKRYFEPLKILGSLSQFSLGVSGIKEETGKEIEKNAQATSSPYYPGDGVAKLIAYQGNASTTPSDALYRRLTDPKDHYYSYLYTALYIREVEAQWSKGGFDISNNPGVVGTLFNIGFANSKPKGAAGVGGSAIDVGGRTYLFGELAGDFYDSKELIAIFPK